MLWFCLHFHIEESDIEYRDITAKIKQKSILYINVKLSESCYFPR